MFAATSPDDQAVGPAERLHPLFLLSGLTGSLRGLAGAYALIGWLAVSGRAWLAILAALGLVVVGLIGAAIYWTRFEFRIGRDEVRIDSGLLSRTHRSIPFDRIQDVDITQGPLQRVLGLARVTFETGGSAARGSEEGMLQAIPLERAQQIRGLIRSRRTVAAAADGAASDEVHTAEGEPVYAMGFGRLLLAGLFNFSLAVLAFLFGLTQTVGDAVGFDPLSERFWRDLLSAGDPVARYAEQHRIAAIGAGALLLVLLGLATGVVRTFLREFGFRLDRTDVGLRRRRGLLTRTDVTLPIRRAQAVIVASGPVRQPFGWSEFHVQSLAQDEGGRGSHVLAPLASSAEVGTILANLGWRPLPGQVEWTRVSSAYVWMRLLALSPLFLILGLEAAAAMLLATATWDAAVYGTAAAGMSVLAPSVFLLVVLVMAVVSRWFAWGRTSYALDGDRLLIRTGWWRRRLLILPAVKIQSIDLTESFITRWFGVATLRFGVAGGGIQGHSIPAIPRDRARTLRRELLASFA